jgi:hypothetical protein
MKKGGTIQLQSGAPPQIIEAVRKIDSGPSL